MIQKILGMLNLQKNQKMNEILTKFFGKKNAQGVENMLNGNFVTAKNAYMMARHGKVCTQVDLLKTFLTELRSLIEVKSGQFEFMCMKHVEEDIVEILPVIINYLTKKLGYKCIVLDPHTTIYNNVNSQDVKSNVKLTKTTLLLFWDEADVSEHLFEDVNPEETTNVVQEAAKTAVAESTEAPEEPSTEEHEQCSSCI